MPSGEETNGKVIRKHPAQDVALVKINRRGLKPLPLKRAKEEVGMDVYAIGSPIAGAFSATVSRGILSAYRGSDNDLIIQSDAMIQGGSSGGPLLDSQGNVIAIAVAKVTKGDGGINFFIPIANALDALSIKLTHKTIAIARKPEPIIPPAPRLGQLIINTVPDKAKVTIQDHGVAYFPGVQLKRGRYKIKVSLPGHETVYKTVNVNEGTNQIHVELERNEIACNACLGIPGCPFVDNGNGTVTDSRTRLIWTRCALDQTWNGESCQNNGAALTIWNVSKASYAGRINWRAPSLKQLKSLVTEECRSPAVYSDVFPNMRGWIASSTEANVPGWFHVLDIDTAKADTQFHSGGNSIYGIRRY